MRALLQDRALISDDELSRKVLYRQSHIAQKFARVVLFGSQFPCFISRTERVWTLMQLCDGCRIVFLSSYVPIIQVLPAVLERCFPIQIKTCRRHINLRKFAQPLFGLYVLNLYPIVFIYSYRDEGYWLIHLLRIT